MKEDIHYTRVELGSPELKELADRVDDENADSLAKHKVRTDPDGQARYMEAYDEIAGRDPVQQSWDDLSVEYHAKTHIFTILARGIEEELGPEKGLEAVRRARQRQGEEMGRKMAESARAKGKRLSLQAFFDEFWSYFSWSPHVDDEKYYDEDGNLVRYVLRQNCHIGDYLAENAPNVDFASNYCDLDKFICQTFNPNVEYHRRHWVPGGDSYSELVWTLPAEGIID